MKKRLKNIRNKKVYILVVIAFAAIGAALLVFTKAATPSATLSVTPSSGSYSNGSNFTVDVYEDSGAQAVNSVSVGLTYDTSKVDFVGVSTTGSAFATGGCPTATGANGKVTIVCFIAPYNTPSSLTGKQNVAKVTFKAKVGSGTTALAFIKESAENSGIFLAGTGENIWDGVTASAGTFTLTTPSTGGTGGGTGGSGGTPTTPTTTSGGSTAPKTSTGTSKSTTPSSSTSATPSPSSPTTTTTDPSVTATTGTSGQVIVKVVDDKGIPLSGINVTLGKMSAVTDSYGLANFSGVVAGSYTISAKTDKGQAKVKIQVKADNAMTAQEFQLQVKPKSPLILYGIIGLGVVAAVVVGGMALSKWQKKNKFNRSHGLGNAAVVFDANSSKPQSAPEPAPTIAPQPTETKGPEGSIITPEPSDPTKPTGI